MKTFDDFKDQARKNFEGSDKFFEYCWELMVENYTVSDSTLQKEVDNYLDGFATDAVNDDSSEFYMYGKTITSDYESTYETNLPYDIAEDEPMIKIYYTFCEEERRTQDYPGSPAQVIIDDIEGIDRELTEEETNKFMNNSKLVYSYEDDILESLDTGDRYSSCDWGSIVQSSIYKY